MDLVHQAGAVYAEHGADGLRRWTARLTWEQRAALYADFDQRWAGFAEAMPVFVEASRVAADSVKKLAARIADLLPKQHGSH